MNLSMKVSLLGASLVILLGVTSAGAQEIGCQLHRESDMTYAGSCSRSDSLVAHLRLHQPTPAEVPLWRGTGDLSWRQQREPLAVDAHTGGTFRTGTQWFALTGIKAEGTLLEFAFDWAQEAMPTRVDLAILRRARSYVPDSAHWSPADDRDAASEPLRGFDCPVTTRRTLFCALYDASVAIAGEYWHGRPAVNAVRQAIAAAGKGALQHPLTDFNNQPTTTLRDVQSVFDAAIREIEQKVRDRGA